MNKVVFLLEASPAKDFTEEQDYEVCDSLTKSDWSTAQFLGFDDTLMIHVGGSLSTDRCAEACSRAAVRVCHCEQILARVGT